MKENRQLFPLRNAVAAVAVMACIALPSLPAFAQLTFTNLHSFSVFTNGAIPVPGLVQGTDGNFYGITSSGGTNGGNGYNYDYGYNYGYNYGSGNGTIFKITTNGLITVLYEFTNGVDGANPQGGLVQGNDGNFYGTTFRGGTNGDGNVFKIATNGVLTVLHSFSGEDGANPLSSLLKGSNGNFYGTTYGGGSNNSGTLFKITTNGSLTFSYSFTNGDDGANPQTALIYGTNGNLYGTGRNGGTHGYGTLFEVATNGQLSTLYSFGSVSQTNINSYEEKCGGTLYTVYYTNVYQLDGTAPNGLVLGSDGNLYGTTYQGGSNINWGSFFTFRTNGLTTLYSFSDRSDGAYPQGSLTQASNGTIYGTTVYGGTNGYGTIFGYSSSSNGFSTLYSFTGGNDGAEPGGSLVQGSNGLLYGTAAFGGAVAGYGGNGTIFSFTTGGVCSGLYSFPGVNDGEYPNALAYDGDGVFFGTAQDGGTNGNNGTVFEYSTNGGFTNLYSFSGGNDGGTPYGAVMVGSDGNLYGTTQYGGVFGNGAIFQISTNGMLTTLYSFTGGNDGYYPSSALVDGGDGNLYGTAQDGGTNGDGTVFRITLNGQFTTLYAFGSIVQINGTNINTFTNPCGVQYKTTNVDLTPLDGSTPNGLVLGYNGNFYGTAQSGGTNGNGTVFAITPNGSFTPLYSFTGFNDGGTPSAPLVQGSDGDYYGTTSQGGFNGAGTIFKITSGGSLTTFYTFSNDVDGGNPASGLLAGSDGNFYGTTPYGGTNYDGNVFEIMTNGTFINLYSFTGGTDGASPESALAQSGDGSLYGTTTTGGLGGFGGVFRVSGGDLPLPEPPTIFAQPTGTSEYSGLFATFSVGAFGTPPLTYQWYGPNGLLQDGANISGANTSTLTVDPLFSASAGTYAVVVADAYGSTNSYTATLNVIPDTTASEDFDAGTNYIAAGDFALADMSLSSALGFSPTNNAYNFFYAVSELLSVPEQPAGSNFLSRLGFGDAGRDIFNWQAEGPTNTNGRLVIPPTLDADEFTAQLRTNVLFAIIDAQSNLAQITNTNFTVDLTTNETHGAAVTVDWGDVQMLQAMGDMAELFIYTTYSWNLDVQITTATNILAKIGNGNDNIQEFLTTNLIFLTTTSTADLPAAKAAFAGAITNYFAASQFIRNRPADEVRLFNLDTNKAVEEFKFRETLTNLLASLNGPTALTVSPSKSVSAQALFDGNFDLRAYLPQFQSNEFLWGTFADPTFGGIITGLTETQVGKGFLKHTKETILDLPGISLSVLYNFTNFSDQTGLVQGLDGNLYGTFMTGGPYINSDPNGFGYGSVFQLKTNGQFNILHYFGSLTNGYGTPLDGGYPNALVLGQDGNFYGTTQEGGNNEEENNNGTFFRIGTSGTLTTLYTFGTSADLYAVEPNAALVQGINGSFYGTTAEGGTFGQGTIFVISSTGVLTNLYSFAGSSDGAYPVAAPLVQGTNGDLYGTTPNGGFGYGTIFKIQSVSPYQFTTLYEFGTQSQFGNPVDGAVPNGLVLGTNGLLYGTTEYGGLNNNYIGEFGGLYIYGPYEAGDGTLFCISPAHPNLFTNLFSFDQNFPDSFNPIGTLITGTGGNFYGVASAGGANKHGGIFVFNVTNADATNVIWLNNISGNYGGNLQSFINFESYYTGNLNPVPSMLAASTNGNLYGTTTDGGTNGDGTVFALNLNAAYTPLLTWASPADIFYGAPLSSSQLDAQVAFGVPGTFIYTPTNGTVLGAGTNVLTAVFVPNNTNYVPAVAIVDLRVLATNSGLIWSNPAPIIYGTLLSSVQLDASSDLPGVFAYNPPINTVLNSGVTTLSVLFTPTDNNYSPVTSNVTITVSRAPLVAAVSNATWTIGLPLPTFMGSLTGLVNGDNITEAFNVTSPTNAAGVFSNAIVPILVDPNNRVANYTVTTNAGTFTIGSIAITSPPTNGPFGAYATNNQGVTFTAVATLPAGVQTLILYTNSVPILTNNSSNNITIVLNNLSQGGYLLSAAATDSNGVTFTSPILYLTESLPGTELIDFDPLAAFGPVVSNAPLSNYLGQAQFSVSLTNNSPGTAVIAENEQNVAGGNFVSLTSLPNLLTQIGSNGPVSFTIGFSNLITNLNFTRPALIASPTGPLTHPAWTAQAYNSLGILLAQTNEPQILIPSSSSNVVPAKIFSLAGEGIASVDFSSEDTNGFTTVNGMLIDDLVLTPNTGNLPPAVLITSPTNGQVFTTSAPLTLTADTAAETGTVTGVAFYYDGTITAGSMASGSGSLFSVTADLPANGIHLVTAVVTNSFSLMSTSAPVSITIATGFAVVTPPASQTIGVGRSAVFSVATTGTNVTYQWQFNGTNIMGATNSSLTVSNAPTSASGSYAVVATSGGQSVTSPAATLTVLGPPSLGSVLMTTSNGNVILSAMVNDVTNFYSHWLLNGTIIPNTTSNYLTGSASVTYTFLDAALNSGNYEVVVANQVASSNSAPMQVNLGPTPVTTNNSLADTLAFDPLAGAVAGINSNSPSSDLNISTIVGKPAGRFLWYQWTTPINTFGVVSLTTRGSSFDTLLGIYTTNGGMLTPVTGDDDSGGFFTSLASFNFQSNTTYEIAVAGYKGASGYVLLETNSYIPNMTQPVITQQPSNQIVKPNTAVTLSVTATNATGYQWFFQNTNTLVGSNAITVISNFLPGDVGNYFVQVSNSVGIVQSALANIEIQNPQGNSGAPTNLAVDKFGDAVDLTGVELPERRGPRDGGGDTGGSLISQSFSTVTATKDQGEPNHAGQPGGASYWYTYTATGPGTLEFDTVGSTFNTILAVYTGPGTSFSTLVPVGDPAGGAFTTNYAVDGQPAVVVSNVVGGTTYYIAIDGYGGAGGDANLNAFFQPLNVALGNGAVIATNSQLIAAINSPANDFFTTTPSATVTGTVRSTGGTAESITSVQVALNTNASTAATLGTASSGPSAGAGGVEEELGSKTITWSIKLALTNGANVITAQAFNTETTNLALVSPPITRTIFYSPTPPSSHVKTNLTLLVSPSGSGKITGETDSSELEINKVYKVTAVANATWIFSNWTSGSSITNLTAVTPDIAAMAFLMNSNLILQANFVSNPFTAYVGNYNGLFYQTNTNGVTEGSSGFFSATIPNASRGAYSAKLLVDGGTYPFSGTFDLTSNAEATVTLPGKLPVIVDLQLTNASQENQIIGSVNNYSLSNGWNSTLLAELAFNPKSESETNHAGRYTLVIPPGTNGPGGYGYVTLTNNPTGHVAISGRLGDGTAISQSVPVSANGNVPLYVSVYSRQGSLLGWLTMTNNSSNTPPQSLQGTNLAWIKVLSHAGTAYAGGFTNTNITVLGSFYTPGAGISVLTNGTLTISNAGMSSALTYSNITIVNNKLTSPNAALTGALTPGTGVLTLKFKLPGSNAETTAQGVLLQIDAQTNAAGWFLNSDTTGYFLLQQ